MRAALVLSILAHSAAILALGPITARLGRAPTAQAPVEDRWTGSSIEVSLAGPSEASQGAAPTQGTAAEPPSHGAGSTPPADSSAPVSSASPAPALAAPSAKSDTAATPADTASSNKAPHPPRKATHKKHKGKASSDKPSDKASSDKPSRPIKPLRFGKMPKAPKVAASSSPSAAPSSEPGPSTSAAGSAGPGSGPGGTFGSEGAAAVRDLGRAFTRAIPAACSADPVWATVAAGGTLTMTALVRVDATGHVTSADATTEEPPKALANLLKRTLPMLQGGTFAVQGDSVTAGTETLELHATVTDEPAQEGSRDDLAFTYAKGRGKASFAIAGGHRVDVTVRVVRVDPAP